MERILIVDEDDNIIGEREKGECHDGEGILHRAFLAMVFNDKGEVLLTKRSGDKRLWPGVWDGSVASHLFRGEDYESASKRRLEEEIGLKGKKANYLFKFRYRAGYKSIGTEQEICAVTVAHATPEEIKPDPAEISGTRFVSPAELAAGIKAASGEYTPWLAIAVAQMTGKWFF